MNRGRITEKINTQENRRAKSAKRETELTDHMNTGGRKRDELLEKK